MTPASFLTRISSAVLKVWWASCRAVSDPWRSTQFQFIVLTKTQAANYKTKQQIIQIHTFKLFSVTISPQYSSVMASCWVDLMLLLCRWTTCWTYFHLSVRSCCTLRPGCCIYIYFPLLLFYCTFWDLLCFLNLQHTMDTASTPCVSMIVLMMVESWNWTLFRIQYAKVTEQCKLMFCTSRVFVYGLRLPPPAAVLQGHVSSLTSLIFMATAVVSTRVSSSTLVQLPSIISLKAVSREVAAPVDTFHKEQ